SRYLTTNVGLSPRTLSIHPHPPAHAPSQTSLFSGSTLMVQLPPPPGHTQLMFTPEPDPSAMRTSAARFFPTFLNSKPLPAFSTLLLLSCFALTRVPVGILPSLLRY